MAQKINKLFFLPLFFLFIFSSVGLSQEDPFSERDYQRLRSGKVLIKTGYHAPGVPEEMGSQIAAIIRLKAPIQRVWDILSNWESYKHIIPNVQEIRLIEQEDNRVLLYFNLSLSVKNIEYFLNYYFYKEKNLVVFQLDRNKKNDFRRFRGYFKFDVVEEDPEFVQIVYSVDVELGKYLPEFLKNYFTKKDMPKVIRNLKKWIEKVEKNQELIQETIDKEIKSKTEQN